jgi:hypothetical protein
MKNTEEFQNLKKELNQLGITKEKEQENVIEFFYNLGKIIYNFKIEDYDEEN